MRPDPTRRVIKVSGEAGFVVDVGMTWDRQAGVAYCVYVAAGEDDVIAAHGADRQGALAQLDVFIAEAQQARAVLENMPEQVVETHRFARGAHPIEAQPNGWTFCCHAVWSDGQCCHERRVYQPNGEEFPSLRTDGWDAYACRRLMDAPTVYERK